MNNLDNNLKNSNIFNHSETSIEGKKSNSIDKSKNRDSAGGGTDAGTENSGLPVQNPDNKIEIPSDINTNACGFYYKDYQVCAGVCDEGRCVSENRSCYCKKID